MLGGKRKEGTEFNGLSWGLSIQLKEVPGGKKGVRKMLIEQ